MDGADVKALAERLGYYSSVPGVFDYNLEDKVKAFQRTHGIKEDGVAGPQTLGMLGNLFPPQMAYSGRVLFTYNGNGTYRRVRDGATVSYSQASAQLTDEWRNDPASRTAGSGSTSAAPSGRFAGATVSGTTSAAGGGGGQRVSFEWKVPARIALTSFDWDAEQARFGSAARNAGFDVQYLSSELTLESTYLKALVMRGLSPSNVITADAINNLLVGLAEQAGFTVARNKAVVKLGQIVDTKNPSGQPSSLILYAALALAGVLVVQSFFDD